MESELGRDGAERSTFAQTLGTLKQRGSNILLVGADSNEIHETACQHLCGTAGGTPRYRLFVTDDADALSTDDRIATEILEFADSERDGSGDEGERPSLGQLGMDVIETIDEFDADADGLEQSELRVCVDVLVRLLQERDTEDVFRLLHVVTARVEQAHGMGHYHLPVSRDHDAVTLLEPMFDAIVELRSTGNTHEQQWHLCDQETTTEWIEL
ncbi:hypothetical protein ACLI4Z_14670 [Natrialbaceae archaeon A-arb3/5]